MGIPWQRHIFPKSCPFSIVCAGAFHYRVRDGNGWFHPAKVTKRFPVEIVYTGYAEACNHLYSFIGLVTHHLLSIVMVVL